MSKLLYITANPKTVESSFSLTIGQAFLNAYKQENPSDEVIELDLYQTEVPLIDQDVLSAWGQLGSGAEFSSLTAAQQQKLAAMNQLLDQFLSADKYVFVTPLWNLSIPPVAKAYIDNIVIAGKTFKYTAEGPQGLLAGKKGLHIQARGGFYSGEAAAFEFGDRYLKTVLSFIGIELLDSVIAEGMSFDPSKAEDIKQAAIVAAQEAAKKL